MDGRLEALGRTDTAVATAIVIIDYIVGTGLCRVSHKRMVYKTKRQAPTLRLPKLRPTAIDIIGCIAGSGV